jgi:two-component system, OmpR family, sensor histidine kinase KdpD
VCIGPSPFSPKLIRATKRMAAGLHAEWFAVYVETTKMVRLPEADRNRVVRNLRLAEQLGAETVTLSGRNIAEEIVEFARHRNITKIVAGKPLRPRWKDVLFGSPVDESVRQSAEIDVHVITGEPGEPRGKRPAATLTAAPVRPVTWPDYEIGVLTFILANVLAFLMYPYFDLSNLIMVYLVGGDAHGHEERPGTGHPRLFLKRVGLRFLFRAAAVHLCRGGYAIFCHLRGDVPGGPGHQPPHRLDSQPSATYP